MAKLTRLTITLPAAAVEADEDMLSALLAQRVSHGWEETRLADGALRCLVHFAPQGDAESESVAARCRDLRACITAVLPQALFEKDAVAPTNWVEAWKDFFTPVEAGAHFLVLAPWMEKERLAGRRIPLVIEPKTAFGTGHHASTALCLEALSSLAGEGRLTAGSRFLDIGAGTGILGLACAKLGLRGDGLDTDPVAVDNALENRALNAVDEKNFRVRTGGIEAADPPYAVVAANILAGPLMDMAASMAVLGADEAGKPTLPLLVLSGILDRQAEQVIEAYAAQGFKRPRVLTRQEWVALIFE